MPSLPKMDEARKVEFAWLFSYYDIPEAPVFGMSWQEAGSCSGRIGKRLPSEAEWEKAASWGPPMETGEIQKYGYPWGAQFDTTKARLGADQPGPVNGNPGDISRYGVVGMAGNVSEWVSDFAILYPGATALGIASPYRQPNNRLSRGRNFRSAVGGSITTYRRDNYPPNVKNGMVTAEGVSIGFFVGFRCAVSADDPRAKPAIEAALAAGK
jgi:iron(II)-dependent oxidoreductase